MINKLPSEAKNKAGIYKINNVWNNEYYIGSTTHLSRRCSTHRFQLRRGIHGNKKLLNAYNKYGNDSFEFLLIEICDKNDLLTKEQVYLDNEKPAYNLKFQAGYGNYSFKPTEEHKEAVRMANKGKIKSPETRKRISESNRGKILSPEHKLKISLCLKDKVLSQETRQKMSIAKKGKKRPIGWRPSTTRLTIEIVIKIKIMLQTMMIKEVFEQLKHLNITKVQIAEISAGRSWKDIKI